MASERELIVVQSPFSANYIIAYEGTNGQIPLRLNGEYTSKHRAQQAINEFQLHRELTTKPAKKKEATGES